MSEWYVLKGREVLPAPPMEEWASLWPKGSRGLVVGPDNPNGTTHCHVADETIKGVRVSTVFLGLDHGWGGGPPLVFETMVFGGALADECERCSTYTEAEEMHARWVARVQESQRVGPRIARALRCAWWALRRGFRGERVGE